MQVTSVLQWSEMQAANPKAPSVLLCPSARPRHSSPAICFWFEEPLHCGLNLLYIFFPPA